MLTQIYEISSPEEAMAVSAIDAPHIGVPAGDGEFPREQPIATVRVAAAIVPPAKFAACPATGASAVGSRNWSIRPSSSPAILGPTTSLGRSGRSDRPVSIPRSRLIGMARKPGVSIASGASLKRLCGRRRLDRSALVL